MGFWSWVGNAAESTWDGAVEGAKYVGSVVAAPVSAVIELVDDTIGTDFFDENNSITQGSYDRFDTLTTPVQAIYHVGEAVVEFGVGSVATMIADDEGYFELHTEDQYKQKKDGSFDRDENGKKILLHEKGDIKRDEKGGYVLKDEYYERFEKNVYGLDENGLQIILHKAGDFKIQQYEEDVYKKYEQDVPKRNSDGSAALDENNEPILLHKAGDFELNADGKKILLHSEGDYMEDKICNRISNSYIADSIETGDNVWVPVGNGLSTVGHYAYEGALHVGATVTGPACALTQGWLHDGTSDFAMGSYDRFINTWQPVRNFAEYAYENPGRALALGTQGVVNATSSTVGFIYDIGSAVVYDYTLRPAAMAIRNTAVAAYNLGIEDEADKAGYANLLSERAFFEGTEYLNEQLQISKLYDEGSRWENKDLEDVFSRVEPEITILVPDGKGGFVESRVINPNANFERVLLYGPQAVAEVGIMIVAGSVTFGTAGGALAVARGSNIAAKGIELTRAGLTLAQKVPGVTTAAKLAVGTTKIATAPVRVLGRAAAHLPGVKPLGRALNRMDSARVLGTAQDVRRVDAARGAIEITEKIAKLEERSPWRFIGGARRQNYLIRGQEAALTRMLDTGARTRPGAWLVRRTGRAGLNPGAEELAHLAQRAGEKLERAREALAALRKPGSGASARQLKKAQKAVDKALKTFEKGKEPIQGLATKQAAEQAAEKLSAASKEVLALKEAGASADKIKAAQEVVESALDTFNKIKNSELVIKEATEELVRAQQQLVALQEAGASAKEIKAAEETVKNTYAALERTQESIKEIKQGLEIAETAAPRGMGAEPGDLKVMWETVKIGSHKGVRLTNPFESPLLEGTIATGVTTLGINADQKNAAAEIEQAGGMIRAGAAASNSAVQEHADEIRRRARGNSAGTQNDGFRDAVEEIERRRPDLKEHFENSGSGQDGKDNNAVSPGSQSGNGGNTSNTFNNSGGGADGAPLSQPVEFIMSVTEEEKAAIERSLEPIGSGPK